MPVPKLDKLLAEFDSATHSDRVRRMAELGRDEGGTKELGRLLDRLGERSSYEYQLALVAAVAAKDTDRVVAALSHPVVGVRSFAFAHLHRVDVADDVLLQAIVGGSQSDRARLGKVIAKARRHDLADRLIDTVQRERGDHEAASLLSACSAHVVRRLLPDLDYAVPSWSSLAARHPGVLLDHAEAALREASPRRRDQLWATMGVGIADASRIDPERVLSLLEDVGPTSVVPRALERELGPLTRRAPHRIAVLLLRRGYRDSLVRQGVPTGVRNNARVLTAADRIALARALRDYPFCLAPWLDCFAPSERGALYDAALEGVDTSRLMVSDPLLSVLPHDVRQREARRMLALRAVQAAPVSVQAFTSYLDIAEARPALDAVIQANKAEERGRGYYLLISCTARSRDPEQLRITLESLARLRNEQDPVRLAACQSLSLVSPLLVDDTHLDALDGLLTAVLEARDTSGATLSSLRQWILRLLVARATEPGSPTFTFALRSLDRLAGPSGTIAFGRLDHALPRGAERDLVATLLPRLQRDAEHDRFDLALALTTSLGKRAWELDDLQKLLGRATKHPLDSVVRRAVPLWLAPPATRGPRVGKLVARDASMVSLPPVLAVITRRRQDLLDVVFAKKPVRGRFLSGKVRFVPLIQGRLGTWLPRQHRAYAKALRALIADKATQLWTVMGAIHTLARLPGIGTDEITPFLSSPDVWRVEAALGGLAWTDTPQRALPVLLSYADSVRARVAVYAATRCARFVPPAELGPALDAVLASDDAKVTARKEAIRLLGIHRPPGAAATLLELGSRAELHRDLRITTGRSLRSFLDDEQAWPVLERLAVGGPDEARSLLETSPAQLAVRHRPRFGGLIAAVTHHPDPLARREAYAALAAWASWLPTAPDLARACIDDIDGTDGGEAWREALGSLVIMFRDGLASPATMALIDSLVTTPDARDDDAAPERDRPRRQRLVTLVHRIVSLPAADRVSRRDDLRLFVRVLANDPTLLSWEVALRIAAIDWEHAGDAMNEIASRVDGRAFALEGAAARLVGVLDGHAAEWQPTDLLPVTDRLIEQGSAAAARLAVAVAAVAGPRSGWNDDWRERLRDLRSFDDPDVVTVALAVVAVAE